MMMQGIRDFSHEATEDDDNDSLSPDEDDTTPTTKKKRKSKNNKRRFTDEQVRSLESIFESETKLEPRKKVQVAKELGLQPRQVAIWFQNKRARWKSKQIEKNYRVLKANYDNLKARLDVIKKDKDSLLRQLQELRSVVDRSSKGRNESEEFMASNQGIKGEHKEEDTGLAGKTSSIQEEIDHQGVVYSDDDKSGNIAYLGQEEPELLNMSENIDGSIIPPVRWCSFDAGSFFDQSSSSSYWWESWT